MIKDINLDYLKIFYVVAKEKNITKAAEKFFISQPALTQTLNKLEKSLGVTLFIRSQKGVKLTPIGEKIFDKVNKGFLELNSIDDVLSDENSLISGKIVIGCGTSIAKKVLTQPIKKFLDIHPNIKLLQVDEQSEKMVEKLELGDIDICILSREAVAGKNINFTKILEEKLVFVCGMQYAKNKISPDKINYIVSSGTSTRKVFDDFMSKNNYELNSAIQIVGYNMAIELALNNVGVAMLPYYVAEQYIKQKQLIIVNSDFESPKIEYGYCYNTHNLSKATAEFINFLNKI